MKAILPLLIAFVVLLFWLIFSLIGRRQFP